MYKSLVLVVTAIAGVVFAQLPTCAQSCVVLPAACPNPLPDCICKQSAWIQNIACCVFANCTSESDRNAVISYANGICQPVGVTLPTTADNCTSNGTASNSSMSSSMSGSMTSSMTSASSGASSGASSVASSASSGASSASSAAASAASTGLANKIAITEQAGFGFAAALMGLAVLL